MTKPDEVFSDEVDNVAPIRKLQPGELLDVVVTMREVLSVTRNSAFTIYASFADISESVELENIAIKARRALEMAGARVYALLDCIEKHPDFVRLRKDAEGKRRADAAARPDK